MAFIGALLWLGIFKRVPLGRLPGDIVFERDGVAIFIPIVTMLLISGLLTLIFWLVGAIKR